MSIHSTTFFTAVLSISLILCGCQEPELRTPEEVVVEEPEPVAPPPEVVQVEPEVVAPEVKEEPTEEIKEVSGPMQPMLSVRQEGEKIVIEGIVKSPKHKDRIRDQLTEAFPKLEIIDNMFVNYDCDAVPWTGRVAEQLLIPYFKEVESPEIDWLEGVITLKGSVKNAKAQQGLTIMAINTFTGPFSKDINNQLRVENE